MQAQDTWRPQIGYATRMPGRLGQGTRTLFVFACNCVRVSVWSASMCVCACLPPPVHVS